MGLEKSYSLQDYYKEIRKIHNIMVLVGNGFDIATLKRFGKGDFKDVSPVYSNFYKYAILTEKISHNNHIKKIMTNNYLDGKQNWCDFECAVDDIISDTQISYLKLEQDLGEIQRAFSSFLNNIVTTEVVVEMNNALKEHYWSITSLSAFLGDIWTENDSEFKFHKETDCHRDMYNYTFVNFNYTMLLDNYIYLDKEKFDPHRHKNVDRNFTFCPNPENKLSNGWNNETKWSSYLAIDVIHPHGYQAIPRSIIFGIDRQSYEQTDVIKRFIKAYWAQYDLKYMKYFDETDLFIIYGMSLSKTDGWWYRNIMRSIRDRDSDLIIYYYCYDMNKESDDDIKKKFISSCSFSTEEYETLDIDKIYKKIVVVKFQENDTYFLGYKGFEKN